MNVDLSWAFKSDFLVYVKLKGFGWVFVRFIYFFFSKIYC